MIFCSNPIPGWKKAASLVLGLAGVMAIWLSLVRTNLLILAGSLFIYAVLLLLQKQWSQLIVFLGVTAGVALTSFSLAMLIGGSSITERFETLVEDDPITVYRSNGRAGWLTDGFSYHLANYPLGAGLGRWGMMRHYFGDPLNPDSPLIFTELQIVAWILDGGIVLLSLYTIALVRAGAHDFRLARLARNPKLRAWSAVIFAINAGTVALVFGFTPFTTQTGLQYWFLAGALHGAAQANSLGRHS
jgi:hypothetical protein